MSDDTTDAYVYTTSLAQSIRGTVDKLFADELQKYRQPDYYVRRHYGKYTIYNKEGWRVAWGLNKPQMENYMKLLKQEN